jgi:hypothetical protein
MRGRQHIDRAGAHRFALEHDCILAERAHQEIALRHVGHRQVDDRDVQIQSVRVASEMANAAANLQHGSEASAFTREAQYAA